MALYCGPTVAYATDVACCPPYVAASPSFPFGRVPSVLSLSGFLLWSVTAGYVTWQASSTPVAAPAPCPVSTAVPLPGAESGEARQQPLGILLLDSTRA